MLNRQTSHLPSHEEMAFNGYFNRRMRGFGLTLIIMGLSFLLYYLGLFGGVSGPLSAGSLGDALAGLGVTRTHVAVVLFAAFLCALSWNWVFNLICRASGRRMTCMEPLGKKGGVCALPVRAAKARESKTGRSIRLYFCQEGHETFASCFHPVKKGVIGHTAWLIAAAFFLICIAI